MRNPKTPYRSRRNLSHSRHQDQTKGRTSLAAAPERQIINLPSAPTCLRPVPVAMRCTQRPRDTIISAAAVTQSRGCPRRFHTADGGSLTQGRVCVPNVASDMPTHHCHGHHRTQYLPRKPYSLLTPQTSLNDIVPSFVTTSGCRTTKLVTSQITVHVPHLRCRYSAVGTVPRLRNL